MGRNTRKFRLALTLLTLLSLLLLVFATVPARAATPIYVRPGGDDTLCNGTVNVDHSAAVEPNCAVATIQKGVDLVDPNGTVNVAAGTYPESVLIDKANLIVKGPQYGVDPTVAGARTVAANEAIITGDGVNDYSVRIGRDTTAAGGGTGVTFDGFLLQGEPTKTTRAVYANRDDPTISNNIIEVANFASDGIALLGEHYPIDSATISQNYIYGTVTSVRAAIRVDSYFGISAQATIKDVVISGNKVVGATNFYDDGVMLARSTGTVLAVWNISITDNLIQGVGAAGSAGIDIYTDASGVPGVRDVTITGNTIDPWNWGIMVDYLGLGVVDATKITVNCNIIFGNTLGARNLGNGSLDAENNWWGCNTGPGTAGCDPVSTNVDADPWLEINISRNPTSIPANGTSTSTITADMTENSDGFDTSILGHIPDGTEIIFDTDKGSIGSPAITKPTTDGEAQATLTSSTTPGTATVTAKAPPHTTAATATTTVEFTAVPPGPPHSLTLTANPTTILANGVTTSTLTATVKDASANAVADGTIVYFSTDLGILAALSRDMVVKTTTDGVATAVLTSSTTAGVATVEAASDGVSDSAEVTMLPRPPRRKKPPRGAVLPVGPVRFVWRARAGAAQYHLRVWRKGESWELVINKVLTRRRFRKRLAAGRYKWKVRAGLGGGVWGPWPKRAWRFRVR